jgi:hypothetical protein
MAVFLRADEILKAREFLKQEYMMEDFKSIKELLMIAGARDVEGAMEQMVLRKEAVDALWKCLEPLLGTQNEYKAEVFASAHLFVAFPSSSPLDKFALTFLTHFETYVQARAKREACSSKDTTVAARVFYKAAQKYVDEERAASSK